MLGEGFAVDQLENEKTLAGRFLESVNRGDVRMVQRREDLRLPLEAHEAIVVLCECLRENLERDAASELDVPGAVDLAHSACADRRDDLVGTQTVARGKAHRERC